MRRRSSPKRLARAGFGHPAPEQFLAIHLRQLVAMPIYGAPGAGQCAVHRAAAATSPRAPGFRYILPRWVEAARAAAAGRGRKMVPSVLLPAFAAPRRTGGAPVREAAQVAGRCAPAG